MSVRRIYRFDGPRNAIRRFRSAVLLGTVALGLASCEGLDKLLEVDVPGQLPVAEVENPANVVPLVAGMTGAFECAFGRYVANAGLIGNELMDTQQGFQNWLYDRRTQTPDNAPYGVNTCSTWAGLYTPISQAQWTASRMVTLLEGWTDAQVANRGAQLAKANAYSGYSLVLLGEGFCSAAVDGGPELTSAQVLERAEARFTSAITQATAANDQAILNMARVGRARVRLDLGKKTEALADARLIPQNYVMLARYADQSSRTRNPLYEYNYFGNTYSVEVIYRNVQDMGVADPRVKVTYPNRRGADATNYIWAQNKYTTANAPIPVARYEEAQLIIAEVEGGQTAVGIINKLHARAGLPLFQSTDAAEIQAHVIQERQRELFLEGQHLYDLIRLKLPLYPAAGAPFQNKGGFYGTQLCQPLPDVERDNNPNLRG